ncbi:RNA polymerase factor sigma-54 [Crenothrix polyspora]|uniref:RNA polymerase sigma-54 factor n=1 Tax=Crenothrix polyspora TaxID=360316 RepID=A0A1R4GZE0_9GAMM|nr:RNA polymerase factor sigma-54 [Crenothrix polyspora]SJM89180.1 RNA polymerase, sigma 54 (sigma N) factor [Crenothrix polyspora]
MKQSIQIRLSQQLTMTPQLQQAIKLLQMSTLDLQQEIQQALDSNMMLEIDDDDNTFQLGMGDALKTDSIDTVLSDDNLQISMPDELPIDSSWEDTYEQTFEGGTHTAELTEFESQRSQAATLQEHLLWQLELTRFSESDHAIAMAIIDSINEDGYLMASTEDICQGLQSQMDDLELDEVNAVLHRIQQFDPTGVAAVNLSDCLRLQLLQLPDTTAYKTEALLVVSKYLNLLASHDQVKLMHVTQLGERQLNLVVALIRTLDPKPGAKIQESDSEYVIPDVYVTKHSGVWQVSLNPEIAPKLRINPFYSTLIKRADSGKDNTSMKDHLQEARWFIKSLHSRNDTLLRVARSIVSKQEAFLENGSIAMKPMILKAIAEELSLHESTISRVTTQKFMHTPNGIVEFKYFFSSHVSTEEGGECSSTAIRAFIKELVSSENPIKPLSDSKMSDLLKDRGINVARRTIAKYREAMFIAPSNERKRIL